MNAEKNLDSSYYNLNGKTETMRARCVAETTRITKMVKYITYHLRCQKVCTTKIENVCDINDNFFNYATTDEESDYSVSN